jgi:hypothetical protein
MGPDGVELRQQSGGERKYKERAQSDCGGILRRLTTKWADCPFFAADARSSAGRRNRLQNQPPKQSAPQQPWERLTTGSRMCNAAAKAWFLIAIIFQDTK